MIMAINMVYATRPMILNPAAVGELVKELQCRNDLVCLSFFCNRTV